MFYQFGKTKNKMRLDKFNRSGLDIAFFLNEGGVFKNFEINFPDDEIYLPLNAKILVDGIEIINNTNSCFFKKSEMLDFGIDLLLFYGKLTQNFLIYDFSSVFIESFDSNEDVKTYLSNQKFFSEKIEEQSYLQYITKTPILKIKIGDTIFDNHIFTLSTQYQLNYATNFKLIITKR